MRLLLFALPLLLIPTQTLGCSDVPEPSPTAPPVVPVGSTSADGLAADGYESQWSDILARVVTADGLVRYDLLRGELRDDLDAVVAAIEDFDASTLGSDAEKKAFWMNAYNARMLDRLLEAGVPSNIEAHGFDFFFETPLRVAGLDVTLNQIENVILRGADGPAELKALAVDRLDPRLHVGVNCGAVSCPRLRQRAFTADNLDAELDAAMRDFVNSRRHFRRDGDGWVVSSLLDWYADDWERAGMPGGDFLLLYLDPKRAHSAVKRVVLAGNTAREIVADDSVQTEYLWALNRAE